jgi:predicted site-specific integrase-resolvase
MTSDIHDVTNDVMLTRQEAMDFLGIKSRVTLRKWCKQGKITRFEISPLVHRYSKRQLQQLIEDSRR